MQHLRWAEKIDRSNGDGTLFKLGHHTLHSVPTYVGNQSHACVKVNMKTAEFEN